MTKPHHTYYTAYVKLGQQEPFTEFTFPATSIQEATLYAMRYADAALPKGALVYKITWQKTETEA